jgi:hypothetical protein
MRKLILLILIMATMAIGCGDELEPGGDDTREAEIEGRYTETLCNSTGYRVVIEVEDGVFYRPPLEEEVCQLPLRCVSGIGNRPCQ